MATAATPRATLRATPDATLEPTSVEIAAGRLAVLLTGGGTGLADPGGRGELEFEATIALRSLERTKAPAEAWAVDGGQALVADARCLQLLVTRAARVRFAGGRCTLEDEGELRAAVLGLGENAAARAALELDGLASDCAVDANLLRDRWEWHAVEQCTEEAEAGALVLVDGDLQPDWRIPSGLLARLLARADERGVVLAGVTKHSSLSRGGVPLLGHLELEAATLFGPRAMWWAPVARTRADVGYGLQVVVARLDPDSRFAFRIDLPAEVDAAPVLGTLSALCDDAAFPGYPYPLTVADRLAACPGWLRADVRMQLDDHFDRVGVPFEVRERAFADRHGLMERA
jgi:hypothetical protein